MKLFSSLSPKRKDDIFKNTIDLISGTIYLPKGLRNEIRKQINLDKIIHNRKVFDKMVKTQRIFTHNGLAFTLNVKEMTKKMEI